MYAAIAGLRTHMQNLNVIGNNVANVNTYGYKSARSVFKTALYTTLSGGSDGTTVVGGANPSQIGYGSTMGSIGIDMSTGNYAVTGMATDLMLDGDGFFILSDKTTAEQFNGTGTDQASCARVMMAMATPPTATSWCPSACPASRSMSRATKRLSILLLTRTPSVSRTPPTR